MSEENLILKNWVEQKKIFIENLTISRKLPTKNSVHDLRVSVKKMRSYLRLNEKLIKEDWKKSFAEIKELFRSFGKLRDFDMSLELCRKYEKQLRITLSSFKEYLTTNRSLTRRWAKLAAITFNEHQPIFTLEFDAIKGLQNGEIVEKIILLSNEKIKKANRLRKHFAKNAHEIRKQLKDVMYWLKTCPKELVEKFIDIKHLDPVLRYLGGWQDQYIFKRKINQYVRSLAGKSEKEILGYLYQRLSDSQKELLERAEKKLDALNIKKATIILGQFEAM